MVEYLHCDQFTTCNSMIVARDLPMDTDSMARAKGWHIWDGVTMGGHQRRVALCGKCVDAGRRKLKPAPPLMPGDQEIIQLEAFVDEAAD